MAEPTDPTIQFLWEVRASIDNIDAAIIYMLAERFRCTRRIGVFKAQHEIAPADPERERQQVHRLRQIAEATSLNPDLAAKLHALIVADVVAAHEVLRR